MIRLIFTGGDKFKICFRPFRFADPAGGFPEQKTPVRGLIGQDDPLGRLGIAGNGCFPDGDSVPVLIYAAVGADQADDSQKQKSAEEK